MLIISLALALTGQCLNLQDWQHHRSYRPWHLVIDASGIILWWISSRLYDNHYSHHILPSLTYFLDSIFHRIYAQLDFPWACVKSYDSTALINSTHTPVRSFSPHTYPIFRACTAEYCPYKVYYFRLCLEVFIWSSFLRDRQWESLVKFRFVGPFEVLCTYHECTTVFRSCWGLELGAEGFDSRTADVVMNLFGKWDQ